MSKTKLTLDDQIIALAYTIGRLAIQKKGTKPFFEGLVELSRQKKIESYCSTTAHWYALSMMDCEVFDIFTTYELDYDFPSDHIDAVTKIYITNWSNGDDRMCRVIRTAITGLCVDYYNHQNLTMKEAA